MTTSDGRTILDEAHVGIVRITDGDAEPMTATVSGDGRRISMRVPRGLVIYPEQRRVVHTGYGFHVPDGYVALAITDGTLAREKGVVVAGGTKIKVPGDDGELIVTMQNLGRDLARIEAGTRIFSIMLCACPTIVLDEIV